MKPKWLRKFQRKESRLQESSKNSFIAIKTEMYKHKQEDEEIIDTFQKMEVNTLVLDAIKQLK